MNTFHKQIIFLYSFLLKMTDHWLIQHDNIFFNGVSFVGHFIDNYDQKIFGNHQLTEKIIGLDSFHHYIIVQTENSILFKTLTSWETKHEIVGPVQAIFQVQSYLCLLNKNCLKIIASDFQTDNLYESYANVFGSVYKKIIITKCVPTCFQNYFNNGFKICFSGMNLVPIYSPY